MGNDITLTDVTASTWRTLSGPPDGTTVPPHASALCLRDVATCRKNTADRIDDKPFFARNSDWTPGLLLDIRSPISWPFTRAGLFKKAARGKGDVLDLAFVAQPPSGYTVKIYKADYGSKVGVPPHAVAVAYPKDLDISKPPPFLVHFKHIPGQAADGTYFKYFDPFGYDWMFWEIWNCIGFNGASSKYPGGTATVDMPFLSGQQNSFGFTYQLRQADKQYVLVLPQISRTFDKSTGQLLDYQFYSAAILREALIDIQRDILSIHDERLAHVAFSAHSSGCNVLAGFLQSNQARVAKDPATATLMKDELNEIFVLDPPEDFGGSMVNALAPWSKLASSRSDFKGKCLRFYTHSYTKEFSNYTGAKPQPFKQGENSIWESPSKNITLAYLPYKADGGDIWKRTYDEILPGGRLSVSNFSFVHHVIPALCLTDAARRSLYV